MRELRALVDQYPGDRVLVGEDEDVAFHGTGDDELHLVFNFPLMRVERLTPAHIRANQADAPGGAARRTPGPATRSATTIRRASGAAMATASRRGAGAPAPGADAAAQGHAVSV